MTRFATTHPRMSRPVSRQGNEIFHFPTLERDMFIYLVNIYMYWSRLFDRNGCDTRLISVSMFFDRFVELGFTGKNEVIMQYSNDHQGEDIRLLLCLSAIHLNFPKDNLITQVMSPTDIFLSFLTLAPTRHVRSTSIAINKCIFVFVMNELPVTHDIILNYLMN